jgi:uncharacterized protein YndB with AHSA1/START domain
VRHVSVAIDIAAPVDRVWRALTVPAEVSQWDGVLPVDVPDRYPLVGQHARWLVRVGPLRLTLHDRIRVVEPGTRLASTIDIGLVHIEEQYTLETTVGGTHVASDNEVSARLPGLHRWAGLQTRWNLEASVRRLKRFCERA